MHSYTAAQGQASRAALFHGVLALPLPLRTTVRALRLRRSPAFDRPKFSRDVQWRWAVGGCSAIVHEYCTGTKPCDKLLHIRLAEEQHPCGTLKRVSAPESLQYDFTVPAKYVRTVHDHASLPTGLRPQYAIACRKPHTASHTTLHHTIRVIPSSQGKQGGRAGGRAEALRSILWYC